MGFAVWAGHCDAGAKQMLELTTRMNDEMMASVSTLLVEGRHHLLLMLDFAGNNRPQARQHGRQLSKLPLFSIEHDRTTCNRPFTQPKQTSSHAIVVPPPMSTPAYLAHNNSTPYQSRISPNPGPHALRPKSHSSSPPVIASRSRPLPSRYRACGNGSASTPRPGPSPSG
jgi:hypothetical protein